jgi:hypothetical protein
VAASRRIILCRYHLWRRGIDDFGLLSAVDRRRCLEPKWKASFEMAQAKAEVAGDNRPMQARLGYWRELEIAAVQSAAGRQDVLAKLEKANERANRLAEAERRSSHHSPGRERLSHFPPGGPPPPRAGAAHETSGRRETEVVGSARRSYTPQGPSWLQSQLTRGCVVSTLRRCSARRFADGIEDGIVYRQAQR